MTDPIHMTASPPRAAPAVPAAPDNGPDRSALRRNAEAFEAAFLAEMLKHTGIVAQSDGGSEGESPFASFMADAYADALMRRGGTGLADRIEQALARRLEGGPS